MSKAIKKRGERKPLSVREQLLKDIKVADGHFNVSKEQIESVREEFPEYANKIFRIFYSAHVLGYGNHFVSELEQINAQIKLKKAFIESQTSKVEKELGEVSAIDKDAVISFDDLWESSNALFTAKADLKQLEDKKKQLSVHTAGVIDKFSVGSIVRVPQVDGSWKEFEAQSIGTTKDDGVHLNALVPKEVSSDAPVEVMINFRGTTGTEDGTLQADLKEGGPGFKDYCAQEESILRHVGAIVKEQADKHPGKEIKLTISGHSLGGALAQIFESSILRAIAGKSWGLGNKQLGINEYLRSFKKIRHIEVNVNDAARVDCNSGAVVGRKNPAKVTSDTVKLTELLRESGQLKSSETNAIMFKGDVVQQLGGSNMNFQGFKPEHKVVNLTRVDNNNQLSSFNHYATNIALFGGAAAAIFFPAIGAGIAAGALVSGLANAGVSCANTHTRNVSTKADVTEDWQSFQFITNKSKAGRKAIKEACAFIGKSSFVNAIKEVVDSIARAPSYILDKAIYGRQNALKVAKREYKLRKALQGTLKDIAQDAAKKARELSSKSTRSKTKKKHSKPVSALKVVNSTTRTPKKIVNIVKKKLKNKKNITTSYTMKTEQSLGFESTPIKHEKRHPSSVAPIC